jgi:hypothetical protein
MSMTLTNAIAAVAAAAAPTATGITHTAGKSDH